jgi:hypothetical protein
VTPLGSPVVRVELSADGGLIDERHYGVNAYRLSSSQPRRAVKAGDTWDFSFTIRID